MILPILVVAPSKERGRGVFASEPIEAQTILEISPVLVFSMTDRKKAEETLLYNYIFEWGEDHKSAAVALGYVSIYNHTVHPNCVYEMDYENETISIITLKDIKVGEELFINYNAEVDQESPVWFEQH